MQVATGVSAYGCWMSRKKVPSADGASTYTEEEFKDKIKLQSAHAQKEIHQNAGSWGSLMQAMYQVSPPRLIPLNISHLLTFFCRVINPSIHGLVCIWCNFSFIDQC